MVSKRKPVSKLTRQKARARARREKELAARQMAMPEKPYGVIYADPPWRFEPYSRRSGLNRSADNHYPTMSHNAIAVLRVPAADDAVLFLWATPPMLRDALSVMAHWGFSYKSQFVWIKPQLGTGFWVRAKHELLLIGTRGKVPAPSPGTQYPSVIEAPRGRHSEKPDVFRQMIETMFPELRRIELFARQRAPGWDVWGNEVDCELEQSLAAMRHLAPHECR